MRRETTKTWAHWFISGKNCEWAFNKVSNKIIDEFCYNVYVTHSAVEISTIKNVEVKQITLPNGESFNVFLKENKKYLPVKI